MLIKNDHVFSLMFKYKHSVYWPKRWMTQICLRITSYKTFNLSNHRQIISNSTSLNQNDMIKNFTNISLICSLTLNWSTCQRFWATKVRSGIQCNRGTDTNIVWIIPADKSLLTLLFLCSRRSNLSDHKGKNVWAFLFE